MDIKNKKVLILGGWGLVGSAVARRIMEENPSGIMLTSLKKEDAVEICNELRTEFKKNKKFFQPSWGNIFVRYELKDTLKEIYLTDPKLRLEVVHDIVDELDEKILTGSALYKLIENYRPEIIIDCINTSTAIAYQDIYNSYNEILKKLDSSEPGELKASVEMMMCTSYIPQLIRHIQILHNSMLRFKTQFYFKVGTSGTGGMGLNIPYTHSEEKPSRVLLSKSSLAGAQTLLMFLMARTPGGPIVKEIKPTGSIAWKRIGYGEIKKYGKPVRIFETDFKDTQKLNGIFNRDTGKNFTTHRNLKTVFIDTGENGIFSKSEYETISTAGQMEYVTPEEIAENLVRELKGGNTGHDVINALDTSVMEPTYRAGFMRNLAIEKLNQLEKINKTDSVAFEMLGPPRLSKLLYEAHIIRLIYKNFNNYIEKKSKAVTDEIFSYLKKNSKLRNEIISIGIPVLFPNGKEMIRGPEMKIPAAKEGDLIKITKHKIDKWADEGWIDLRERNWTKWKKRFNNIKADSLSMTSDAKSSRFIFDKDYWGNFEEINIGKVVSWIFMNEDKGLRYKG